MMEQIGLRKKWLKKYRVSGYYYEDFAYSYPQAELMAKKISAYTDRWGKIQAKFNSKRKKIKQIFFCWHTKHGFDIDNKII